MVSSKSNAELCAVSRARKSTKGMQRPTYRRRVKPPFSYAELITMAIKASPNAMMTLREILEHMSTTYECFRGSYVGWKNSVRHNLSASECFIKVLRNSKRPYGKDNFWTLNASCPHCLGAREVPVNTGAGASSPLPSLPHRPRSSTPSPALLSPGEVQLSSEDATAPHRSTPSIHGQEAPLARWPSPTPGHTPDMDDHLLPVSQSFDDWSQLDDLFTPDADLDLALYNDGLDLADSHQAFTPIQERVYNPSADHPYSSATLIKDEPQSPPPYPPASFSSHTGAYLFPHGVTSRHMQYLPYITTAATSRLNAKSEHISHPSSCVYSRDQMWRSSGVQRGFGMTGFGMKEPGHREDGFGLGSIVASAIRGSLSLDLDESALQAIERSVRLLDQPRPSDLSYA